MNDQLGHTAENGLDQVPHTCPTHLADMVKQTTPGAIKALHRLGIRIIMATGDTERTARAVAGRLGIDDIRADVLPQDKVRVIAEL
ncbi:HAD family hydrolase [Allopontixanthobacter sp.]|uniref:HAD family hydrolase n=1 Tax=Allopontixanthobacter sp. TaxID=2906452 RepID=UPI002ABC9F85|nr:HAD family hydrolase [Allopontixanthobacter sp.]MDZ4308133.1 HAD family hydrolase [Allopontixanthobacter sp.]